MENQPRIRGWTAFAVLALFSFLAISNGQDSVRKLPPRPALISQFDSATSLKQLQSDLQTLFSNRTYRQTRYSVCVRSLSRDEVLFEDNPNVCLTPASTSKLFSTTAAFHALGGNGSINTEVRATGKLDAEGTLHGDLYLVGHGDALLNVNDIEELADAVIDAGVKRVTGHVYGDGTFFDKTTDRAIYSGDFEEVQPLAPITALSLNRNTLAVIVSTSSNGIVTAQTLPSSDAVVLSRATSVSRSKSTPKKSTIKKSTPKKSSSKKSPPKKSAPKKSSSRKLGEIPDPFSAPQRYGDSAPSFVAEYVSARQPTKKKKKGRRSRRARAPRIGVRSSIDAQGKQIITYSGAPGRNRTATVYVSMAVPTTVAAGTLSHRLRSGGVTISDSVGSIKTPSSSRVIATFRRPLTEVASIVNKRSDNYLAEHIFKIVGGLYGGQVNTAARAKEMILSTLDSLRVERNNCVMNDGSGLSRRNLVCARTEVDLLRAVAFSPYAQEFLSTLSIASVDGTLRGRMHGSLAAGNMRGKTGSLRNTSALAGYVTTRDGERLVFSVISNGPYIRSYKATENRVAMLLAGFSYDRRKITEPIPIPDPKEIDTTSPDLEEVFPEVQDEE